MIVERGRCLVFPVMNGIHINITFFIRFSLQSLHRLYFQCYLKESLLCWFWSKCWRLHNVGNVTLYEPLNIRCYNSMDLRANGIFNVLYFIKHSFSPIFSYLFNSKPEILAYFICSLNNIASLRSHKNMIVYFLLTNSFCFL